MFRKHEKEGLFFGKKGSFLFWIWGFLAPISIEIGKMLLRGGAHTPKQSLSSKVMGGLFLRNRMLSLIFLINWTPYEALNDASFESFVIE